MSLDETLDSNLLEKKSGDYQGKRVNPRCVAGAAHV